VTKRVINIPGASEELSEFMGSKSLRLQEFIHKDDRMEVNMNRPGESKHYQTAPVQLVNHRPAKFYEHITRIYVRYRT